MPNKPVKAQKKAPVQNLILNDVKKYGTEAQQVELNEFVHSLSQDQLQVVQALVTRFTTGACINGDGTIDADTGLKTTGGYRKSVHWLKAFFANQPRPVQLK